MTRTKLFPIFFVFLLLGSFVLGAVPFAYAASYTVELWVDNFDNAQADWVEAGSSPYLESVGAGNITSTTRYNQEKNFGYTNFTSSFTTITSVQLCFYGKTNGNDGLNLYLTNSSGEQTVVTSQWLTVSFAWYNYTVTSTLPSNAEINTGTTRFHSMRNGAVMDSVTVDASLIRVTYSLVSASSFTLSQTVTATSSLSQTKALGKTLSATTATSSDLSTNKALNKPLTATFTVPTNIDATKGISAINIEVVNSSTLSFPNTLTTQKAIGKNLVEAVAFISELTSSKTIFVDQFEFLLSQTASIGSALSVNKTLTNILTGVITWISSLTSSKTVNVNEVEVLASQTATIGSALLVTKSLTNLLTGVVVWASSVTATKTINVDTLEVVTSQTINLASILETVRQLTVTLGESSVFNSIFDTTLGVKINLVEALDHFHIQELFSNPFSDGLVSMGEALALALVASIVSCCTVWIFFMVRRKQNERQY